jgi:RNA polymerase sigma factor (sigma-70 family)
MAALFRQTRAGAVDRLYREHGASIYRYVYAVVGKHADAEDIVQQTFLNAYRAIEQGTKPRKPENWLFTIAHNEVRRHFRKSQLKPLEVELDEELARPAPERSDPSIPDLLRALQRIPAAQRSALVMREFEGRSYREIARTLGITERGLETLIFRARRSLAEQLEDALTCAEAEDAFLRRLDGRLPRREARRLKAHAKECLACARFGRAQNRQRSLLKGLSVMPVPLPLFLFRGETAAAAGGSASVGAGAAATGVGAGGVAAGVVAKAAALTAAAVVAGGAGYEVAAGPVLATTAKPDAAQAVVVVDRPDARSVIGRAAHAAGGASSGAPAAARRTTRPAKARAAQIAAAAAKAKKPKRSVRPPTAHVRTPPGEARGRKVYLPKAAVKTPPPTAKSPVRSGAKPERATKPREGKAVRRGQLARTDAAKPAKDAPVTAKPLRGQASRAEDGPALKEAPAPTPPPKPEHPARS